MQSSLDGSAARAEGYAIIGELVVFREAPRWNKYYSPDE